MLRNACSEGRTCDVLTLARLAGCVMPIRLLRLKKGWTGKVGESGESRTQLTETGAGKGTGDSSLHPHDTAVGLKEN